MSAIFEQTGLDNLFTTEQTNFIHTGGNPQERTALENAATQIVGSDRKADVFLRQIQTMGDLRAWQMQLADYRQYSPLPRIRKAQLVCIPEPEPGQLPIHPKTDLAQLIAKPIQLGVPGGQKTAGGQVAGQKTAGGQVLEQIAEIGR